MFRLVNQEDLFNAGYYFYFGSAKGSGGLQARLLRHISMEKKKFWHIDYLRPYMDFVAAVFTMQTNQECVWCQKIQENDAFKVPVQRSVPAIVYHPAKPIYCIRIF
jgi:Uri superfamily endonuclease